MYELKNRYEMLFSATQFLDEIVASVLKRNLYFRTIF